METRMEKYRRKRREKFLRFIKFNILLCMIIILYIGIFNVNNTIIELNWMNNPQLFSIDKGNKSLNILGKNYILDFNLIKKFLKTS